MFILHIFQSVILKVSDWNLTLVTETEKVNNPYQSCQLSRIRRDSPSLYLFVQLSRLYPSFSMFCKKMIFQVVYTSHVLPINFCHNCNIFAKLVKTQATYVTLACIALYTRAYLCYVCGVFVPSGLPTLTHWAWHSSNCPIFKHLTPVSRIAPFWEKNFYCKLLHYFLLKIIKITII